MRKWTWVLMVAIWTGAAAAPPSETVVLDAANMTCPTCSITIEKALERVAGVTDAQVDVERATVTVTFDSARASAPDIARAITEAGFPAKARTNGG